MTRQRVTQRPPDRPLDGFPTKVSRDDLYRCSRQSPWWFCTDGDCRFDLVDSVHLGTLYAGTDPVTGVLEMLGEELLETVVSVDMLASRTVWALRPERPVELADLNHPAALGFGVTNELSTMVPYTIPQRWASALSEAGVDGIAYRTRFNPSPRSTGVALFGPAGSHDRPAQAISRGDDVSVTNALAEFGITVASAPHVRQLDLR